MIKKTNMKLFHNYYVGQPGAITNLMACTEE